MNYDIEIQIKRLKDSVKSEHFIHTASEVVAAIESCEHSTEAIVPIIELIEQNPDVDFGSPGPLVHFIEKHSWKEYEIMLMESIRRCPTPHTLWMLGRMINGAQNDMRQEYVALLEAVVMDNNLAEQVIERAERFLSHHR